MARASTAFIFLALIAAAGHVDALCGVATRGCNAPAQFSGMKKSTTLPTIVASTGITQDFKDKLDEGHQVLINFAGGAGPTTAYILEGGGADAAYADFKTKNCEQTTFEGYCGADKLITQAKNSQGQGTQAFKGSGGKTCSCGHALESSAALYYILDSSTTAEVVGERAVHEMCHVTQMSRGEYFPTWLVEGGAVHTECLLQKKLTWSTQTYEDCFRTGGGRGGVIPNFRSYYDSTYGYTNGLKKGELRECGGFVGNSDTEATQKAGGADPSHLYYDTGTVAIAYIINKAGITSQQFWQSNELGKGFWNTIVPFDGHDLRTGYPGQCPEDKGWKKSLLAITKHATVAEFYAEFDAWAKTASVADVVAILETQSAIDTQTAGVFDLSTATEGTDHDPCGSATQWPPSPPPAPPSPPPPPLSAGSSLSGVVSAVVAAATVVLAGTGRA
ncbi:predicted protein [Micromonas commoda]|uniref:Uncharacterized protein n=1 Tax=Micromonas commoda (strain RCC299 / NOUM17 / CCMP2709) TaxID=296587 RepID=C1E5V2_MICCC|nr:predicted protein [Micromonas commoda]ACO63697.1 predicted protein [Micromonas commoda]|eukprot:XP_002502439.1 predicted protein [Micromonas commoda]